MSCAGLGDIKIATAESELSNVYYCLQGIGLDITDSALSEKEVGSYQMSEPIPTAPESVTAEIPSITTTTVPPSRSNGTLMFHVAPAHSPVVGGALKPRAPLEPRGLAQYHNN